MELDEGYLEVWWLFEKEYGDLYKVLLVYMRKFICWLIFKYDDGFVLKSFFIFLRKCNSVMKIILYLVVLNYLLNM